MRVLMITSEWPTEEMPNSGPFVRRQVEFLRRADVQIDVYHFRGARSSMNYLRAWRGVRQKLMNDDYDLIHAQWGHSALLTLPKRRPLVITFRGDDLEGIIGKNGRQTVVGRVLRLISRAVARLADQLIVVSEKLARHLPGHSYHVIPSGLDLEMFQPLPKTQVRRELCLPPDKHLVLFAANPDNPRKRYELARAAVTRLKDSFDVELVTASDIPHRLMPSYMNACDVLLLTSVHEGSPNVVKEALACNLPVVSVDIGDVRQRIGDVEGCLLCDDDQPKTIADGLAHILSRKVLIDGRSSVCDLDESRLAQKVISVYKLAISKYQSKH